MPDKNRLWDNLERILNIIAVIVLFLFIYIHMNFELSDPDIWLHIKTGEYIVKHRAIPKIDTFSAVVSGKEWIDHSWLTQVIFYLVFNSGGADNLIMLSAIIVTLAFWVLFSTAYKSTGNLLLPVSALFITIFASTTRFNIRPENFSLLFFSFFLFMLTRRVRSRMLLLLPAIQLLWVNCHGFYVLGPLLVVTRIIAEKLKNPSLLPWEWAKVETLDALSYKNLKKIFALVCLASFLNPYGYKGALYPIWITFHAAGRLGIFYNYIRELMPTWYHPATYEYYYILAGLSFLAFAINFKRININYLLLWLFFFAISVRINRNIIFFNFIAFLSVTDSLNNDFNLNKISLARLRKYFPNEILRPFKCLILLLIIISVSMHGSNMLNSSYYIFEEARTKSSFLGITAKECAAKAADFMLENNLPKNIFNFFNDGSYLIYRLAPKGKVFIDGRTELYGGAFFEDYEKILNVNKNTIASLFKKYNINTVLISQPFFDMHGLARYFYTSRGWALVYFDADALIFLKNNTQNKNLINKFKVDLDNWLVASADIKKIGLRRVLPEPYLKRAWIFYYLGLYEQAVSEAKEGLRMLPSSTDAHNILCRIYLKKKLYDQAFESLRLARIYAGLDKETLISLGSFYLKTDKINDAINSFKKLTKVAPRFPESYYLLSHAYSKSGNINLAIHSLKTAIKLNPYQPKYYQELGALFYQDKKPREATRLYQKAVSLSLDTKHFYENPKK